MAQRTSGISSWDRGASCPIKRRSRSNCLKLHDLGDKFYLFFLRARTKPEIRKINLCLPKAWNYAFKNLIKRRVYRSRAEAIRKMLYPALLRELKRFNSEIKIEHIIEHKNVIKKPIVPKRFTVLRNFNVSVPKRNLGYRKPKRKKEKKPSVPRRRALERSGINQRKRKAKKNEEVCYSKVYS